MSDSETESVRLVVEELPELPEKERYKCEVCNMDFYKRYQTPYQNARALEGHLKRQSHRHNVERRKLGLEPEKLYAIASVGKQLGELVERFGSRLDDLEELLRTQTRRLESLESGSVRSWLATVPAHGAPPESEASESVFDPSESLHQPEPERASARCRETTQLGLPRSMGLDCQSDACSEDTTTTDITEAEYPPSHTTPSSSDYSQSYNRLQNRKVLVRPFEEESSRFGRAMMSKVSVFAPTELETSAIYGYDGNNYAFMVQISNMLERLMIWLKQNCVGQKLTANLQYIHRTQSALNVQMRQRLNSEPRDAEDTELLLDRLYSVLEHDWND